MRIQSNLKPQAPASLNKAQAPKQPDQPDAPPPNDGNDIDWGLVRTAACRGAAVGLVSAAGGILPGGFGMVASGGLGAYTAYKVMNNPEAALGGAFVGVLANAAQSHFGLLGVPLGMAIGAMATTSGEMRRQMGV